MLASRTLTTLATIATMAVPAVASDFRASNRMTVTVTANGDFEVTGNPRLGPRSYFCAAGEYGLARLGLGKTDKIYVAVPQTRGNGPVSFSATSGDVQPSRHFSLLKTLRVEGGFVSVGQAEDYCNDFQLEFIRSFRDRS